MTSSVCAKCASISNGAHSDASNGNCDICSGGLSRLKHGIKWQTIATQPQSKVAKITAREASAMHITPWKEFEFKEPRTSQFTPKDLSRKVSRPRTSTDSIERPLKKRKLDEEPPPPGTQFKHLYPITSFSNLATSAAKDIQAPLVWRQPFRVAAAAAPPPPPPSPPPLRTTPAPAPAPEPPRPLFAPPPRHPRHITLSPAALSNPSSPPIPYQTLSLLLNNLNRLLLTPHHDRAFAFRGTYAFIAGVPSPGTPNSAAPPLDALFLKSQLLSVAWELLDRTVLAFDVHKLVVHADGKVAVATIRSSAGLGGGGHGASKTNGKSAKRKGKEQEKARGPCDRCEHLLTISVCLEESMYVVAARVIVALVHFDYD
ncbi:hypothetical protein R3P38DRAFT_2861588 [Favolaschia claudopus]|uniref:Uncharacterized protein n=1 Tax=Favolaschia claudopus TaxID=2862362 RepID=A0AAW0DM08_9AGAR